jgi:chromosomal replication initiation ATPase DnaA
VGMVEVFPPPDLGPLRAGVAQVLVAHTYGVTIDDMLAPTRLSRKAAFARQIAIYLCRAVFQMENGDLAHAFVRDRSTICNALKYVQEARTDPEFDRTLRWLEATMRAVAVRRT